MFMGHGQAQHVLELFLASAGSHELKWVLQVSMDGPKWEISDLKKSK